MRQEQQTSAALQRVVCIPAPWQRYLVNADGSTAAWRLATLLMKNSLVIKQASLNIEWCVQLELVKTNSQRAACLVLSSCPRLGPHERRYYGAVQPCVHYIPYW